MTGSESLFSNTVVLYFLLLVEASASFKIKKQNTLFYKQPTVSLLIITEFAFLLNSMLNISCFVAIGGLG